MWKNQVTPQEVVDYLNTLVEADGRAILTLSLLRVPCNEKLADHPSCQVGTEPGVGSNRVGLIGVLNGIFGTNDAGWGNIAATFKDGRLTCFVLLTDEEARNSHPRRLRR